MKSLAVLLMLLAVASVQGAAPNFTDNFDSLYAEGDTFTTATNGWQASGSGAYVTNSGAYSGKAVFMDGAVGLTNSMTVDQNLRVWTDFQIKPMLGVSLLSPPTNDSSFLCYFNSNGYVVIYQPSGEVTCTNDVWGNAVPKVANDYVRFSLFQDFATSNQAVFLNDQLILQDLCFVGTPANWERPAICPTCTTRTRPAGGML